jgi:hypothetical protein
MDLGRVHTLDELAAAVVAERDSLLPGVRQALEGYYEPTVNNYEQLFTSLDDFPELDESPGFNWTVGRLATLNDVYRSVTGNFMPTPDWPAGEDLEDEQ